MRVKGLVRCLGHSRCLGSVRSWACVCCFSFSPGGQQDPRAETEEAWDSADPAHPWSGAVSARASHLQPEFTSYSFRARRFMLNFIIRVWLEPAYPYP